MVGNNSCQKLDFYLNIEFKSEDKKIELDPEQKNLQRNFRDLWSIIKPKEFFY